MTDLTADAPSVDRIREDYLAQTQRKRVYGGILLILFVSLMVAGFRTADSRNAGSFVDGWHRIFDYPAEVLSEAWTEMVTLTDWRRETGHWESRRAAQADYWFHKEVRQGVLALLETGAAKEAIDSLGAQVTAGQITPSAAADRVLGLLDLKTG